jgi:hypothetical protein
MKNKETLHEARTGEEQEEITITSESKPGTPSALLEQEIVQMITELERNSTAVEAAIQELGGTVSIESLLHALPLETQEQILAEACGKIEKTLPPYTLWSHLEAETEPEYDIQKGLHMMNPVARLKEIFQGDAPAWEKITELLESPFVAQLGAVEASSGYTRKLAKKIREKLDRAYGM